MLSILLLWGQSHQRTAAARSLDVAVEMILADPDRSASILHMCLTGQPHTGFEAVALQCLLETADRDFRSFTTLCRAVLPDLVALANTHLLARETSDSPLSSRISRDVALVLYRLLGESIDVMLVSCVSNRRTSLFQRHAPVSASVIDTLDSGRETVHGDNMERPYCTSINQNGMVIVGHTPIAESWTRATSSATSGVEYSDIYVLTAHGTTLILRPLMIELETEDACVQQEAEREREDRDSDRDGAVEREDPTGVIQSTPLAVEFLAGHGAMLVVTSVCKGYTKDGVEGARRAEERLSREQEVETEVEEDLQHQREKQGERETDTPVYTVSVCAYTHSAVSHAQRRRTRVHSPPLFRDSQSITLRPLPRQSSPAALEEGGRERERHHCQESPQVKATISRVNPGEVTADVCISTDIGEAEARFVFRQ
ncbi:hypothetical protein KIPB_005094 [Kipferlia bialata]|uniref:Uncharacterized protein n=1 Tax=Kipferlia bialata TaxID=797122 RepID=A0A9K3CVJ0_9EUKA|nr:hypothetical protein KIPB_005094 [Kipferlia bialata]|eukprot:g5094.t1